MTVLVLVSIFVVLMLIGMPIAFAIGIASAIAAMSMDVMTNMTIVRRMIFGINSFPLLAVIFFVFTGVIMANGGVAGRLVRLAEVIVGRLPGGLGQINVMSSMLFGGVSGSAVADVSSIGRMMIEAMEKDGYTRRFATSLTLASATMGPIIPPSISMILYAYIAGSVSVGGLLLAGLTPGLMIGGGLLLVAYVHGRLYHNTRTPPLSTREKLWRVVDGGLGMMTLVIILGGITSGVFTATEAGAIAAVYALFLTMVIYREVKVKDLPGLMWESICTTAVVLFLIATTSIFTFILTYENVPQWISENILHLTDNRYLVLLIINILLLVTGLFIDLTPALIMLVPILLPLAEAMGIDLIHLGVIMVVNLTFGLITPPVGTALFVGCRIARISMVELVRPLMPMLGIMFVVLMIITYFPATFMWAPRMFGFAP
ncbi:TRAP transporter large permease [Acuticoccus sp. M5D2P5]|uniref:TRAP transporter large permease n=1 Tax=Acuticoccus kalidii TaxID=2910977 RepID=UPI001F434697|nr:TRAP transporter large permease [Acuticoccus kalidii]MCF3935180.1 TRAP transporter large permease [Acuticoccus kalidii]